jgi:alpha-tubulin suppressor-like RCC1 family protein
MASGNMHHAIGADDSCISWGAAVHGELGYGPNGQKYVLKSVNYMLSTSIQILQYLDLFYLNLWSNMFVM